MPRIQWALLLTAVFHTHSKAQLNLIPPCAVYCYNLAVEGVDGCTVGNPACYCTSPASDEIIACLRGDCDTAGLQQFIDLSEQGCEVFGGLVTSAAPASATTNVATSVAVPASSTLTPSPGTVTTASLATSSLTTIMQTVFPPATTAPTSSPSIITQTTFQPATTVASSSNNQPTGAIPVATTGSVSSSQNNTVGITAGSVVGGVVLVLAILASVWFRLRRRRQRAANVFAVPTGPINAMGAGVGSNHGGGGGATYVEEGKMELPSGVDSAPISSGMKPELLPTVVVDEVEHLHRL